MMEALNPHHLALLNKQDYIHNHLLLEIKMIATNKNNLTDNTTEPMTLTEYSDEEFCTQVKI
eukprot:3709909-Ditylum_brightwellii.AAC.1